MSRTLFHYVFWQLIKVFGLASAVIAGIMTFGGLLKPLTENGLELSQVGQMLVYAWPGMSTYSLPIAALFATTIVYGRLAADNEITAVRAAGVSLGPLGLGMPALVLGLLVALLSVASLSFIVPAATLRVERTVVSNIGQFVVNRISQQHKVNLYQPGGGSPLTIYARSATLEPPDPKFPGEQIVTLEGVSIVTYSSSDRNPNFKAPDEFYIAERAQAFIRQPSDAEGEEKPVLLRATMERGVKFPRSLVGRSEGAIQGGVGTSGFGPIELRSPLRENTKFMDVRKLKELGDHPEKSVRISESLRDLARHEQQTQFLTALKKEADGIGVIKFKATSGLEYTLQPGAAVVNLDKKSGSLTFSSPASTDGTAEPVVRFIQTRRDIASIEDLARDAKIKCFPDTESNRISLTIELTDTTTRGPDYESPKSNKEQRLSVAMPPDIARIALQPVETYQTIEGMPAQVANLNRNLMKQKNSVDSELHSRVSFALSCLVLTIVGYGLGVMFKSGNYLSAFAVAVIPALLSIVLIVSGQHICENVPQNVGPGFKDPRDLGLVVIWTGNAIVLVIAITLLVKLRRT